MGNQGLRFPKWLSNNSPKTHSHIQTVPSSAQPKSDSPMSWLGSLNQPVTIPCWFSILPAVFAFCWLSERIRRHQMSSGNRGRWDQWLLDLLGLCGASLFVTTWSLSFMGCALSQGVFSFPLIAVTFTLREMGCFSWEINMYLTHFYMCCILDPKSFFIQETAVLLFLIEVVLPKVLDTSWE